MKLASIGERTATTHRIAQRIIIALNAYVVVRGPSRPLDQSRGRCFREGFILLEHHLCPEENRAPPVAIVDRSLYSSRGTGLLLHGDGSTFQDHVVSKPFHQPLLFAGFNCI